MNIYIAPYNPEWPQQYEILRQSIQTVGGEMIAAIEHVGSTSVEGLGAKPIVDIMVGLQDFEKDANDFAVKMQAAHFLYIDKWEQVMPYRRFFNWYEGEQNKSNIHTVQLGGEFWNRHLLFRNYLRKFPEKRDAYYQHKVKLAAQTWDSTSDYAGAKTAFIRSMEAEAGEYFG